MRKILSAIAGLAMTGSAFAADLPGTKSVSYPVPGFVETGFYAGVFGGGLVGKSNGGILGGQVGYDVGYFRAEANLERDSFAAIGTNTVTGNLIAQYPIRDVFPATVVPYALGGGGYTWGPNGTSPVWNVGGGLRVDVTNNIAFDARYRYISATDSFYTNANYGTLAHANAVTLGVQYKF
jgi:opacity protein-like surface antigen